MNTIDQYVTVSQSFRFHRLVNSKVVEDYSEKRNNYEVVKHLINDTKNNLGIYSTNWMAWKRQYFDSVNENKIEHSSCLLLTKWYYCYTSYMVLLLYYSECFAKRPFFIRARWIRNHHTQIWITVRTSRTGQIHVRFRICHTCANCLEQFFTSWSIGDFSTSVNVFEGQRDFHHIGWNLSFKQGTFFGKFMNHDELKWKSRTVYCLQYTSILTIGFGLNLYANIIRFRYTSNSSSSFSILSGFAAPTPEASNDTLPLNSWK